MAASIPRIRFRTEYICLKCGARDDELRRACRKCGGPMCPRVIKIAVS